jgi:hypothetical protein
MKCFLTKFLLLAVLTLTFLSFRVNPVSAATFQMQTGYYLGDGSDNRAVTGVGFQPDLVIIKDDNTNGIYGAVWKSSNMTGENSSLLADAIADIATDAIQSLDSDGFTLGTHGDVNAANVRFTWIAYRGNDCTSSGTLCIGSYTGDGTATRAITGVGFAPNLVVVKNVGAVSATFRTTSMPVNTANMFSGANEITDGTVFKTLDSDGFTVGNHARTNTAATQYWFFALKSVAGAFAEGTYTGDGLDNRSITAPGFMPDYVWVKNANATTPVRASFNLTESYGDNSGGFSDAVNAVNQIQTLDTTGFTIGSDAAVNENTKTFYWLAFGGAVDPVASGTYNMSVGTYTGNGTAQSISGLTFAPDLVIIKDGANAVHSVFRTRHMKGDLTSYLANTVAHFAGGITSLNSTGFSVGADSTVNTLGATYHYQAFGNAFDPENNSGAADFMIGSYIGSVSDNRDIGRMPFQPSFVAIKGNSTASGMWRTSNQTGDASFGFSGVAESADNIQALNSDGFEVGTSTRVNGGTTTFFYFFAFKTSATMKVGSYSGTGSAQNITDIGFSSALLWLKSTGGANAVFRPSTVVGNSTLFFPNSVSAADRITALLSNGFSVGGSQLETNTAATTYRYAAWKANEVPSTPTLDSPADTATGVSATPALQTTATDLESDYLKYKIELCTNVGMTTGCQTYDQTASQTGWSGQNAATSTAYTSGTQATYTVQTALSYNTTYYWRSYAIDPVGSNTFSGTQTPRSFTTLAVPSAPSALSGTADSTTSIVWSWTDNASNEAGFYVQDTSNVTKCTVASSASGTGTTVTCTESGLSPGTTYTRRVVAYNAAGNSTASSDASASTTPATGSFSIDLLDPSHNSYTSSDRPSFKWRAVTNSASGIARYDFFDHEGSLSLAGIPASRTTDYETSKYIVRYENFADSDDYNNYISLQTKSSSEWGNEENSGNVDGKIKEGIHKWQVKAVDNNGVEQLSERILFVDRSSPQLVASYQSNGDKPRFVGVGADRLSGYKTDNKVASGPSKVEIKLEKRGTFGVYSTYSFTTVQIDPLYLMDPYRVITDNSQQSGDKYGDFNYTLSSALPDGIYRSVMTVKDHAGNNSGSVSVTFNLGPVSTTSPSDDTNPPLTTQIDVSDEETVVVVASPHPTTSPLTIQAVTSPSPESDSRTVKVMGGLASVYWNIVDWFKWVGGGIGTGIKTVASALGSFFVGIGTSYDRLAANTPGFFGNVLRGIENRVLSTGRFVSSASSRTWSMSRRFRINIASTFDVWFNRDPVRIEDVQIAEITKNSVVITWKTNHYTYNNKVNYGTNLSYGQEAYSEDKAKEHKVHLTGLASGTKYVFEVMSQGKNYAYDAHYEFTTAE